MFYTINENERGHSQVKGSIIRHGRAIWNVSEQNRFEWEWKLLSKRVSAGIDIASHENAITVRFCVWLFSLYFSWENHKAETWLQRVTKRADQRYGNGREIGFSWLEGTLMVSLWADPTEWRKVDPWWWQLSITPLDVLLGRAKYSERILDEGIRQLTLPERSYEVKIKINEAAWKRPRWPWPKKIVRTEAEVEGGIPVPGKGTTDYNCGDDAIYSQTSPGATFDEALAGLFKSVIHKREHYPL